MTDSENNIAEQKKNLRKALKQKLSALSISREIATTRFYRNLLSLEVARRAKTIGIYVDFRTEAPTRELILRIFESDDFPALERIAVPRCVDDQMRFYRLNKPRFDNIKREVVFDDLSLSPPFGILEPNDSVVNDRQRYVEPSQIDVLIIPGLAFDATGRRLGRGAGYYDRYIPQLRPDSVLVGYCFDEQIVDRVPTSEHDALVDYLLSPGALIKTCATNR